MNLVIEILEVHSCLRYFFAISVPRFMASSISDNFLIPVFERISSCFNCSFSISSSLNYEFLWVNPQFTINSEYIVRSLRRVPTNNLKLFTTFWSLKEFSLSKAKRAMTTVRSMWNLLWIFWLHYSVVFWVFLWEFWKPELREKSSEEFSLIFERLESVQ